MVSFAKIYIFRIFVAKAKRINTQKMEFLTKWTVSVLSSLGIKPEVAGVVDQVIIIITILVIAYLADLVCRRGLVRVVRKLTDRTKAKWDDLLFNDRVMNNLCHIIPPVIIYALIPIAFPNQMEILILIHNICLIYIVAVALRFTNVFLGALFELTNQREELRNRPLKGVYQIIQVGLFFVGIIIIISILIDKSPKDLFVGLGASAAILMLVFKDTIMGLVSGVQLSANDMLRPGDWITMPKYGADGTVVEVTLNTVKVRNFDNTITTVPPYALVSDSFQNWRGMRESGGRRVKRSINIDMTSVCFCTPEMLRKFKKVLLLKEYIAETEELVRRYNEEHGIDDSVMINGMHQTNLGVFRAYLERYLHSLPTINKNLTYMVRQLQPTEKGIPIEIYFFADTTDWIPYEKIQADVFDHVLAIIPEFGLRVFQNPSGADVEKALRR